MIGTHVKYAMTKIVAYREGNDCSCFFSVRDGAGACMGCDKKRPGSNYRKSEFES